jgi:hypothetical protein
MHSYRFLIGLALVVVLVGAVSSIDLARAGAQPAWLQASGEAPVARLTGPEAIGSGLDSPNGQLQFGAGLQGGGFNLQGGGFNFGGGGFNFGGGQFNGGGFNLGGFNVGSLGQGGGFNFQGGIDSPLAAGGGGRLIAVTGHLDCSVIGEVVGINLVLSQPATGAVATGDTQVACTSARSLWTGQVVAAGPASFLPGTVQACALAIGPVTRTQWCRPGNATLVATATVLVAVPPPPMPPLLPLLLPPPLPAAPLPAPASEPAVLSDAPPGS